MIRYFVYGSHSAHEVVDGCTQGGCDAQPAFCLAEHQGLKRFAASAVAKPRSISVGVLCVSDRTAAPARVCRQGECDEDAHDVGSGCGRST